MGVTAEQARRLRMERWARRRDRKNARKLRALVGALRRIEQAGRGAAQAMRVLAEAIKGAQP